MMNSLGVNNAPIQKAIDKIGPKTKSEQNPYLINMIKKIGIAANKVHVAHTYQYL